MAEKKLTYKQEAAAQVYMRTGDKSAAYREVYKCDKMKSSSINSKAYELFENVFVWGRVKELQAEAEKIAKEKFGVTSEEILGHLNILRNAKIDEYVNLSYKKVATKEKDENGAFIYDEVPVILFKPFSELTKEQLMCIESIKQTRNGIELKLHGIDWTIDKICKHIGFYEKDNKQKNSADALNMEDRSARIAELMEKFNKNK